MKAVPLRPDLLDLHFWGCQKFYLKINGHCSRMLIIILVILDYKESFLKVKQWESVSFHSALTLDGGFVYTLHLGFIILHNDQLTRVSQTCWTISSRILNVSRSSENKSKLVLLIPNAQEDTYPLMKLMKYFLLNILYQALYSALVD